jgi:succinate dehydrogenase hydrophobic anchor subunit
MKLIGILLFVAITALTIYVYYVFLNIALAIWLPKKSKEKWIVFVESPACQVFFPFLKWVVPAWVLLVPVGLALQIINYAASM